MRLKLLIICLFWLFANQLSAVEIVPAPGAIVEKIEWKTTLSLKERFKYYFEDLNNKTWDPTLFKVKIDQINRELFQSGFLTSSTHFEITGSPNRIKIILQIQASERTTFTFVGNRLFSKQEIQAKLMDRIKNDFGKTDIKTLENFIVEEYEIAGFYGTQVKSSNLDGNVTDGGKVKNYYFSITEGKKIIIEKISLRGGYHLSDSELVTLVSKSSSGLASNMFYDKIFFENFTDAIKKEYLRRGYPFAEVSLPHIIKHDNDSKIEIEYSVNEKQQVILDKININQVSSLKSEEIKKLILNKEGAPLNILELEDDLKRVITNLQNEGYYFVSIANLNSKTLLTYDKSRTRAELNINIITDRQVCFNDTIINGNIKTKGEVLYREVQLRPGDLITPDKLEEIKSKISGLGLFSSTKITPYMLFDGSVKTCAKTNLVIQVKEKEFGLMEIAPGYRTDLGWKFSTNTVYNNLFGLNKSVTFKSHLNRRDNLAGFDEGRARANKTRLEYSLSASVVEPYMFYEFLGTQIESEISASWQRKRFYGFDADIFRISPQLAKNFNKYFSSSIKYQFEEIDQFDATLTKDNDNFSIGGITLSSSLDFRDDPINTRRGPYLSLSAEWAAPLFGSMDTQELQVNFLKIISRNKYYYPIGDFTFAFSLGMGMEKNYATNGYIPSIKVFRLDGYEEIRGYDEGEINHLATGEAIGDVVVDNMAYFQAFKFEPRYNINDNIQVHLFFDAGRVSIESFKPLDLRTSAGLGLKFLTAVGALDFSYGVKLNKKTYSDGKIDSTGRFHLSIGYF